MSVEWRLYAQIERYDTANDEYQNEEEVYLGRFDSNEAVTSALGRVIWAAQGSPKCAASRSYGLSDCRCKYSYCSHKKENQE